MKIKLSKGFTLIELMVTVVVLVILAFMAVPVIQDTTLRENLNSSTHDLIGRLNEARSKAVIERAEIVVELHAVDDPFIADTINQFNWYPKGQSILAVGSPTTITFQLTGGVSGAVGDTIFVLCDQVGGNRSREIQVSRMGTISPIVEGTC